MQHSAGTDRVSYWPEAVAPGCDPLYGLRSETTQGSTFAFEPESFSKSEAFNRAHQASLNQLDPFLIPNHLSYHFNDGLRSWPFYLSQAVME